MLFLGEIAGLATAFCWTATSLFFTAAGTRVGAYSVNLIRITLAVPMLGLTLWLSHSGSGLEGVNQGFLLLALSGVIGLAVGDGMLFQAMVMAGPRKTTLMMSLWPIITALISLIFLKERLSLAAWSGIILTTGGIAWVVGERNRGDVFKLEGSRWIVWFFLALGAAVCQSVGFVIAKAGMGATMDPLTATLIRMISAGVVLWIYTAATPRRLEVVAALRQPRAMWLTSGGAVVGPYLGVWLSLVALKYTKAGVAATLMATIPIWMIPAVWWAYGERTGSRAWLGTVAAIAGIALLLMR